MKKFTEKSNLTDQQVTRAISSLWMKLIYNVGMRAQVEECLKPVSKIIDFNSKCQKELELLYNTGKFSKKIFKYGKVYWSFKMKQSRVVINDQWHPADKLNTNPLDQALLITDIFRIMNKMEEIKSVISSGADLVKYLKDFFQQNSLKELTDKFNINVLDYTYNIQKNSAIGEAAETQVAESLKGIGCELLFRGGDGDPIDMAFGCDLVISKDGKVILVQVKSKEDNAYTASIDPNYSHIDLFAYVEQGKGIGFIDDSILKN